MSGFGGSEKSTCAQRLSEGWGNAALVIADHTFHFRPFDVETEGGRAMIGRVKLRNCLAMIETFLDEGFAHVICEGLVWSQRELDAVVEAVRGRGCDVRMVWLDTSKEDRFRRALKRSDPGDDEEFLETVERQIPKPAPFRIDPAAGTAAYVATDGKTPEQVATEVLAAL